MFFAKGFVDVYELRLSRRSTGRAFLLIEYAWLGLPRAVGDDKRMKMLMFAELPWVLQNLLGFIDRCTQQKL